MAILVGGLPWLTDVFNKRIFYVLFIFFMKIVLFLFNAFFCFPEASKSPCDFSYSFDKEKFTSIILKAKYSTSGDKYILYWKNIPDAKVDYYILEKSIDGVSYTTLIKLVNTENKKYYFRDSVTNSKFVYYHLISVDKFGIKTLHNTLKILNKTN